MALSPTRLAPARPAPAWLLARDMIRGLAVSRTMDVLLVGALMVVAGVVRWPHLLMSPQFPSVGDSIMMALDMAQGRAFYLHDQAPYLGAPFIWLLALVYKLFGPSIETTMVLMWVIGSLTVVPTYLLGREVGGRPVAVIAGAFLATSGAHTVVSSHVALSHSVTPLAATAALWLVARAVTSGQGWVRPLAWAGLLAGLALQTHPTSAPLLVGAGLGAVLMRPGWLRTRGLPLAVAMVLVGYSTLLVYHVTSHFEIVGDIAGKQERYLDADVDAGEDSDYGVYVNNLAQLSLATVRLVSGALAERPLVSSYLEDPWIVATVGLTLAGIGVAGWRRQWWLVGAVALAVFLPPAFSGKYRPVLDGRYLMPLVPVLFVAIGLAAAAAARWIVALSGAVGTAGQPAVQLAPRLAGSVAVLVLSGGVTLLAAHPLSLLNTFYEDSMEDGFSNALYLRTLQQVEAARRPDETVLLDPALANVKSTGGGKASSSFTFLFALEGVPNDTLNTARLDNLVGRLVILNRSTANRMSDMLRLDPLDGKRVSGRDTANYRAYRIGETLAVGR
ncbi:MAG: glycosyltransferase family 39 protein [Chloroflexota bacterium]